MRASTVMLTAVVAAVIGRWAHNKKAADPKTIVEAVFAVLVIAFLDQGKTEPIARGFAWLFLAAVMLGKDSPITVLTTTGATALGQATGNLTPAAGGAALGAGASVTGKTIDGAGAGLARKKGS